MSVDIAVAAQAQLGECPIWSPEEERLYWVDIDGRAVHRFDPATGLDEARRTPGRPGSIVRTDEPGRFLMATEHEAVWFDWDSGACTPWLTLEQPGTGNRMNDGRTDPTGRYWVGSMFEIAAADRFTGHLHRIESDGSFDTPRHEIGVTNGLAFDPERGRMYFADTLRDTVWVYDYDLDTGQTSNERVFIDFSDQPGRPDGACVDAEGGYWVAAVHGWSVLRFTPEGRLDRRIELPVEKPTMPAFGGADLGTLFVTSIGDGGTYAASPGQHEPGGVFAIDAGVTGRVDPRFAGGWPNH